MQIIAALLTLLLMSLATAQDNKYAGTGMSVTGPASEKKPPEPVKGTAGTAGPPTGNQEITEARKKNYPQPTARHRTHFKKKVHRRGPN
jgi:hypothetical protein